MREFEIPPTLNERAWEIFEGNTRKGFWGEVAEELLSDHKATIPDIRLAARRARDPYRVLMLIVTEVAEAAELLRDDADLAKERYTLIVPGDSKAHREIRYKIQDAKQYFQHISDAPDSWQEVDLTQTWQRKLFTDFGASIKPVGFPSEIADVLIRVLDACGAWGIDIDQAVKEKLDFNASRPGKHGRSE